ncbi:hypothetical protein Tco_0584988, partial [Tanacetum coccineum]
VLISFWQYRIDWKKSIGCRLVAAGCRLVWAFFKVLTPVSTDMLGRIFDGFGNISIRSTAYQEIVFLGNRGMKLYNKKGMKALTDIEEVPFDVSDIRKKPNDSLEGLNLTRPAPKKGLQRLATVSEIPKYGDRNWRDAPLKKRGFPLNKDMKNTKRVGNSENQNPNFSIPPKHKANLQLLSNLFEKKALFGYFKKAREVIGTENIEEVINGCSGQLDLRCERYKDNSADGSNEVTGPNGETEL